MGWQTPSLAEVRRLNRDAISAALPGADATVPNSVLRVMSDANAGLAYLTLLYIDWLAKQLLPDTAETEWLDRHAQIWVGGRKSAGYASGVVTLTGIQGVIVPTGTRLEASSQLEYETTEEIILDVIPTSVSVRALTPGAGANQVEGASLTVGTAVAGLNATAAVLEITGGVEVENDDDLRERVLFRIRKTPMGGSKDDYVRWTSAVPGVTRAWSYPLEMGMGTVTVRFMMDTLRAGTGGFPTDADLATVAAYLDVVRPVAVKDIFIEAPIPYPLNLTISALSTDSVSTRSAIQSAVRKMLFERAIPGQTIFRSWMDECISQALGEDHHELVFETAVMPGPGYMAVLGTIAFNA